MDKPNKHIVLTFARANPPHAGHIKLFRHMRAHAAKVGADHRVFLTHTQDSKENPLDHATKVHMVRQMDPKVNVSHDKHIKTIMDMMKQVQKEGYKKVTVVTGTDRKKELSNLLHKYNGGSDFNIPTIHFHEVARDPDNGGVSGLSATKMRSAAKSGDFKTFRKGVPNKKHAKELYMATRKGMKTESYKAFYLLGGPCSGKDILLRKTILGEVCEVQLNQLHNAILHKKDIKEISEGHSLVVNGNAYEPTKVMLSKQVLESMGYETRCIYVDVTDGVSCYRNSQRDKTMNEAVRAERYVDSVANATKYQAAFSKFYRINNEDGVVHEDSELWGDFVAQLNEFYTGKNIDKMVEEFLDEGLTGATRMDIQKAYDHTFTHAPGWTVAQRTAHVEKHHQVKDVKINSYGDVVDYKHLHEDKTTETGANKVLSQTARMNKLGIKKPVQNQGTSNYYNHIANTQVAKHAAGAAKEKTVPVKKPQQPVTTSAAGTHSEAVGSFKAFKKLNGDKKRSLTKAAKDPVTSFDSRTSDGMAMTATFAAEAKIPRNTVNHMTTPLEIERAKRHLVVSARGTTEHSSKAEAKALVKKLNAKEWPGTASYKSLKKIKEESTPTSPQYDLPEVYEDWGLKSEVVIFEGREVSTNRPFKTNEGYAVYVDGQSRIEFQKKSGTAEDWS